MAYTEPAGGHRPLIGDIDVLEASIGRRGMGKSTHQCMRALELSRRFGGAYVIGHSLGSRLPDRLPLELGGDTLPIKYHTSLRKLEWGLRWDPNKWHILAPVPGSNETADDLLRFAIRLSETIRRQAWNREHPWPWQIWRPTVKYLGLPCVPIIVLVDEGIAVEGAGPSRKEQNRWFLELIYSVRHYHIALLWSIQDSSARSWRIMDVATAVHVFAVKHEWSLTALRAAGATEDELAKIRELRRYEHLTLEWAPERRISAQKELAADIQSAKQRP